MRDRRITARARIGTSGDKSHHKIIHGKADMLLCFQKKTVEII
jgi:hypothetical protein